MKDKEKAQDIILVKPENKDCEDLYNKATEKIDLLSAIIAIANTNKTVAQSLFTKIRSDNCIMFIPQK